MKISDNMGKLACCGLCFLLVLVETGLPGKAVAGDYMVNSIDDLVNVHRKSGCGSTITLKNGRYEISEAITLSGLTGTKENPCLIKAETSGNVTFAGRGGLLLKDCFYVVFQGFDYESLQGLKVQDCRNVRITECEFRLQQNGVRKDWVAFRNSTHIRVDNCAFGPRTDAGSFLHFNNGNRYIQVDHNFFHDYEELGFNGGESIYLHGSGVWAMWAVVENNRFERCDGEHELIGIKSHRNIVRNNVFLNCKGGVSVRDGNYNQVYNNLFICTHEEMAGTIGIRVFGKHNAFVNNYLYRIEAPVELMWGEVDAPHIEEYRVFAKVKFEYRAARDNLIAFNTFYRCGQMYNIGKKGVIIPEDAFDEHKFGPFRSLLWETDIKQHLVGSYVQPVHAPCNFYMMGNVIFEPEKWVEEYYRREAQPPIDEKDFVWESNYLYAEKAIDFKGRTFDASQVTIQQIPFKEVADYIFEPDFDHLSLPQIGLDEAKVDKYFTGKHIHDLLQRCLQPGANLTLIDIAIHDFDLDCQ